jgi:tRNA pseudouridine55 synthase
MTAPNKPVPEPAGSGEKTTGLNGILIVDKPVGPTSMDVIRSIRRWSGGTKAGHAGTLDPLADGVLIVALGRGTKAIERLMATDKRYRTRVDLSANTASGDRESPREEVEVAVPPSRTDVEAALAGLTGEVLQRPPAASAVKVGGRRAYALQRKGEDVKMPPRQVTVHSIEVVEYDWPMVEIDVHCEKGTYIRSLARDLGVALGTGGYCVTLRRTAVGPFTDEEATRLDDLPERLEQRHLMTVDEALSRIA